MPPSERRLPASPGVPAEPPEDPHAPRSDLEGECPSLNCKTEQRKSFHYFFFVSVFSIFILVSWCSTRLSAALMLLRDRASDHSVFAFIYFTPARNVSPSLAQLCKFL